MVKVFIPVKSEVELATSLADYIIERKFGKTPRFMIIDSETLDYEVFQNKSRHMGGQGCTADMVSDNDAKVAITAHLGPGAWKNLKERDITVLRGELRTPIPTLIEKYNNNELSEFPEPKGHSHNHDHNH